MLWRGSVDSTRSASLDPLPLRRSPDFLTASSGASIQVRISLRRQCDPKERNLIWAPCNPPRLAAILRPGKANPHQCTAPSMCKFCGDLPLYEE